MSTPTVSITENLVERWRRRPVVSKPGRSWWVTLVKIFSKNLVLLIVIMGLVEMIWKLALKSVDSSGGPVLNFERQIAEVESEVNHRIEKLSETLEKKLGGLGAVEFLRNVKGADNGDMEVIRMVAITCLRKKSRGMLLMGSVGSTMH